MAGIEWVFRHRWHIILSIFACDSDVLMQMKIKTSFDKRLSYPSGVWAAALFHVHNSFFG